MKDLAPHITRQRLVIEGKPYLGSDSSTPIIINTENLLSLIQEKSRIIHFFLTRVVRQIGYFNMGNLVIR